MKLIAWVCKSTSISYPQKGNAARQKILKCLYYVSAVLSHVHKKPIASTVIQIQQIFSLELELFLAFSSNIYLLSMEIKDLKVLTALSKNAFPHTEKWV